MRKDLNMSANMTARNIFFIVNTGSLETITVVIQDSNGNVIDLTNTTTYNAVKLLVWQPNGTAIINYASGTFGTRNQGQVQYTFSAADTASANAGNWEGIFVIYNNDSPTAHISQYSDVFNITIRSIGSG